MFVELFHALCGHRVASLIVTVGILWLVWRLWTFTIRPAVWSDKPRQLPYWIPGLGHTVSFLRNSDKLFTETRLYLDNTREPFAVTVGGQTLYVVTSPQDANTLYRNVSTLNHDEIVMELMKCLGQDDVGMGKLWSQQGDSKSEKCPARQIQDLYHRQLVPGPLFDSLFESIASQFRNRLTWDNIPDKVIVERGDMWMKLDLWAWCQEILLEVVTTAFYGKVLYQLQPDLTQLTTTFDDNSWKLLYQLPQCAAKDVHGALNAIKSTLQRYMDIVKDQDDAAWVTNVVKNKAKDLRITTKELSVILMMLHWGINSNAYKMTFWVIATIIQDRQLLDKVRLETRYAMDGPEDEFGIRLDKCAQLNAICQEVLRIGTNSASVRSVASDTRLGSKILRAGSKIMVPARQLHMDENSWGPAPQLFNIERVLQGSKSSQTSSFRPFGGGATLCTGRHMALREVLAFTSFAINQLDVQLPEGNQRSFEEVLNLADLTMPSLGVMPVLPGKTVHVIVRKV